jgi:hypothetical protein
MAPGQENSNHSLPVKIASGKTGSGKIADRQNHLFNRLPKSQIY